MRISIRQLEGRDHYVVPTVMIGEGVWCGSGGPVLYPAKSLADSVPYWNGRPVVVYHPEMIVSGGAAAHPEVFNRQKVGTVFNTRFHNKQLKCEAWIDCQRVAQVDSRVNGAILTNQMMEVSTGLYGGQREQGTWNGKEYIGIADTIRPDHLAILPDQRGACSVADGAGLLRNGVAADDPKLVFKPMPLIAANYVPYVPPVLPLELPRMKF